jgi:hypothetical protein
MTTYKIVRTFGGVHHARTRRTIKRGLTLKQAMAHCRNPETNSRTATGPEATARTEKYSAWSDAFTSEGN